MTPKINKSYKRKKPIPVDENGEVLQHPKYPERRADGRFLHADLIPGKNTFTSQNSIEMWRKRREKYLQAAADALVVEGKAINPNVTSSAEVWGMLIASQFVKAMDYDKPQPQIVETIGQAIGALATGREYKDIALSDQKLPPEFMKNVENLILIIQRSKDIERGDVIDAKVRDYAPEEREVEEDN